MNKIERAIQEAKNHIKNLEKDQLIIESKIDAFKNMLITLERIESLQSIPHEEVKII